MINRRYFTNKRKALHATQKKHAAKRANLRLSAVLKRLPRQSYIGVYIDAFGELPTTFAIQNILHFGHIPCVPMVHKQMLQFYPISIQYASKTINFYGAFFGKTHPLGMKQPLLKSQLLSINQLSACLCPLVAVSKNGVRLGMGGGFYDRTLAGTAVLKIAHAYDFQLVNDLPKNAWDVDMDIIITPTRLIYV